MNFVIIAVGASRGQSKGFEYPAINFWSGFAENMSLNVFVAKHAARINIFQNPHEVIETWIQLPKGFWSQVVCLGPMRATSMTKENGFESLKEFSIWNTKSVGLKLDDTDPTGPLTITRTQPYVVHIRKSNFDRKMRPETMRICEFFVQPGPKFEEASVRINIRNRPLCCVLRISAVEIENTMTVVYSHRLLVYEPCSKAADPYIDKQKIAGDK